MQRQDSGSQAAVYTMPSVTNWQPRHFSSSHVASMSSTYSAKWSISPAPFVPARARASASRDCGRPMISPLHSIKRKLFPSSSGAYTSVRKPRDS